jgi:hypothetical protein
LQSLTQWPVIRGTQLFDEFGSRTITVKILWHLIVDYMMDVSLLDPVLKELAAIQTAQQPINSK